MSDLLVAPERETFPQRKRWTREECYALMEDGKLTGRWELIDGEILSKMGQKPPHSFLLNILAQWIVSVVGFAHIRLQEPITITGTTGRTNEPEPDIAVTREPTTAYADHHPAPDDLHLVVEVADTTPRFDLETKALLYARAGVREYWVADVVGRQIHCHRNPTTDGYTEVVVLSEADNLTLTAYPEASVQFGDLLPPETPAV